MTNINLSTLTREQACALNPFIGSTFAEETFDNISYGLAMLHAIDYTGDMIGNSTVTGIYFLCVTMQAAAKFESSHLSTERQKNRQAA